MWEVDSLNGATWEVAQKRLVHQKSERWDVIPQKGGSWLASIQVGNWRLAPITGGR